MVFAGTTLWLVGLTVVLLWTPQNVQHEGAHALVAKRYGAEIVMFKPYPNGALGYFAFASMAWSGGKCTDKDRALISIAPQLTNTFLLIVLVIVRYAVPEIPEVTASILAGWALTNYLDGMWNLGTFYRGLIPGLPEPDEENKHTDGWSFQKRMGLNKWLCRVCAAVWHVAFGYLVFIPLLG